MKKPVPLIPKGFPLKKVKKTEGNRLTQTHLENGHKRTKEVGR